MDSSGVVFRRSRRNRPSSRDRSPQQQASSAVNRFVEISPLIGRSPLSFLDTPTTTIDLIEVNVSERGKCVYRTNQYRHRPFFSLSVFCLLVKMEEKEVFFFDCSCVLYQVCLVFAGYSRSVRSLFAIKKTKTMGRSRDRSYSRSPSRSRSRSGSLSSTSSGRTAKARNWVNRAFDLDETSHRWFSLEWRRRLSVASVGLGRRREPTRGREALSRLRTVE